MVINSCSATNVHSYYIGLLPFPSSLLCCLLIFFFDSILPISGLFCRMEVADVDSPPFTNLLGSFVLLLPPSILQWVFSSLPLRALMWGGRGGRKDTFYQGPEAPHYYEEKIFHGS